MNAARQQFKIMTALIALLGVSLLGIAVSAALNGVWSAAVFIGVLALVLLVTVGVGLKRVCFAKPCASSPLP